MYNAPELNGVAYLILFTIFITYSTVCSPAQLNHLESKGNVDADAINNRRQSSFNCTKNQFACKSGDCVLLSKLCNGVNDCKDSSDETIHVCRNRKCPRNSFKCKYGACIDLALKCNGRNDCADNSDETSIECPTTSTSSRVLRKCKANEWRCRVSGDCILKYYKCNGKNDCEDTTDETLPECEGVHQRCPASKFHCNNGDCVDLAAKCNGTRECADGSDESNCSQSTKPTTTRATTKIGQVPNSDDICPLPSGPDTTVVLTDDSGNWLNVSLRSHAPKFSNVQVFCTSKYSLPNDEKVQKSLCVSKGKWNPPLIPCLKKCPPLSVLNVDLLCYRKGAKVDCQDGAVNGTTVRPRCRPLYHSDTDVYREIRCQENGEWDSELLECVPDCGITNTQLTETQTLIIDGKPANASDSPWHVAIYKRKVGSPEILICGGTLISTNMVVSAAHCFFDEGKGVPVNSPADYEVAVSKHSRDYHTVDNSFQKKYAIREIMFTDLGYNPNILGQHSNDIAVLVLKNKVEMNNFVLPACVEWTSDSFQPPEGTPGKLVGWGVDKVKDVGSPTLLHAELPFISLPQCAGKLKQIDSDKFCAGSDTGPGARKGDSGGGLMFRDANSGRYYLRGIVSTTDKDYRVNVATFTDVAKYVDWLDRVRTGLLKELTKAELASIGVCDVPYGPENKVDIFDKSDNWLNVSPGSKTPEFSKIEITCNPGYTLSSGENFQRSVCFQKEKWNPPLKPCLNTCPSLSAQNVDLSCYRDGLETDCNKEMIFGTVLRPRCKPLYQKDKKVSYRELKCQENGEWDHELFNCVPDCGIPTTEPAQPPLTTNWTSANASDSPWHVAIYQFSYGNSVRCGGTLISANLIVTAAHCFFNETIGVALNSTADFEVVVSKHTRDHGIVDNKFQKKYEIRDVIYTDVGYDPNLWGHHGNNIVALVLKKPVEMNKFVLPACIDWTSNMTGFQPADGTPGRVVGWPHDGKNPILQHAEFQFMSFSRCQARATIFITSDKFCAGTDTGASIRRGLSGGGLVFRDNGRYFLRGIAVGIPKKNNSVVIPVFTDVSRHINWLKKIYDEVQEEMMKDETTSALSNGICDLPDDVGIKVDLFDHDDNWLNISSGAKAPKFSKIEITCNSRHLLLSGDKRQRSVCVENGTWNPPLKPCLKTCPTLEAVNMNLACHRGGSRVNCDGELIYGTSVQPRCNPLYKRLGNRLYRELRCQASGEWDHEPFECVPDCGIQGTVSSSPTSMTGWTRVERGNSPWHVTILRRNHSPAAPVGGTLISNRIVISAAHYFYDTQAGTALNSTKDYLLIVGIYTLESNIIDDITVKKYEISKIVFTDRGYNPSKSEDNNIIIFVTTKPIETNSFVLPACVDWSSNLSTTRPIEGTSGKVVSWQPTIQLSMNTSARDSKILQETELQIVSPRKCLRLFKKYPIDIFCAGSRTNGHYGRGAQGFVVYDPNNKRYFLRGIVGKTAEDGSLEYGAFTDVAKHTLWLGRVRDTLDKELLTEGR